MAVITHEELLSLLHYDPETGVFTWLKGKHRGKRAGAPHGAGYIQIQCGNKNFLEHRLAWFYMTGNLPSLQIDHKDGNRSNNVWNNLREASSRENQQNQGRAKKNNVSGFLGVSPAKRGKWRSTIRSESKQTHLGSFFTTPEEAHAAYLAAKARLHPFWAGRTV